MLENLKTMDLIGLTLYEDDQVDLVDTERGSIDTLVALFGVVFRSACDYLNREYEGDCHIGDYRFDLYSRLMGVAGAGVNGPRRYLHLLRAMSVRVMYCQGRRLAASESEDSRAKGIALLDLFCELMLVIEKMAMHVNKEEGEIPDPAVYLWAMQGRATAMAALGRTEDQIHLNRNVIIKSDECGFDETDPEIRFVLDLALYGLAENDPQFLDQFGLEKWEIAVSRAYDRRYPDFPGRALALAKYLDSVGRYEEASSLIAKAVSSPVRQPGGFGKPSQIHRAELYAMRDRIS